MEEVLSELKIGLCPGCHNSGAIQQTRRIVSAKMNERCSVSERAIGGAGVWARETEIPTKSVAKVIKLAGRNMFTDSNLS